MGICSVNFYRQIQTLELTNMVDLPKIAEEYFLKYTGNAVTYIIPNFAELSEKP
jgi:hypothetical protein